MKRAGKQIDMGSALGRLVKKMDRGSGGALAQATAKDTWARLAGASVLAHTTGAHLRGTELVVFVDSNVWANELTALSGRYLSEFESVLGKGTVRSIRFTVSRKVAEEFRIQRLEQAASEDRKKDKVDSVPLSEEELAQVKASVAVIEDDELRETAFKATVADLEWKKGLRMAEGREGGSESV